MKLSNKGKNFSANNLGQRKPRDAYATPYGLTRLLLEAEEFTSPVLEPAIGEGAIVKILQEHGYEVHGYDRYVGPENLRQNFLTETQCYPCVVTNPPFSLAAEFITTCKAVAIDKFALLLPLSYLHGETRFQTVWQDREYPLKCTYVFTRYPMMGDALRADGKTRTGMIVMAWYVWDRWWAGAPEIRWLSNDKYIVRKGDDVQ